jgi:hypothetical protein
MGSFTTSSFSCEAERAGQGLAVAAAEQEGEAFQVILMRLRRAASASVVTHDVPTLADSCLASLGP